MLSNRGFYKARRGAVPRAIGTATQIVAVCFALTAYADAPLTLPEAVRQAIESNLDLAAEGQALEAARHEIGLARSALLPQVQIGGRAEHLDDERPSKAGGDSETHSVSFAAGLRQSLYDEQSWANFEIEKHTYDGQSSQLEAFELGVIQSAATLYLELDQSVQVLEIERKNRKITLDNLETSRARVAAGWSSEREELRWKLQLADNNTEVRGAEVRVLQNRFELNRLRSRPPEQAVSTQPVTVDDYGFAYTRRAITDAVVDPATDERMRDFMVRFGLDRSPELAALDAAIAASQRNLTASKRAFWVPTFTLGADVERSENGGTGPEFDETFWGVNTELSFPLFSGGAKFSRFAQAGRADVSLRTQRRATAQTIERTIRAAFAQSSGSFESVGFANQQEAAARKNYELVDKSYTLGVASILDLLDAQEQQLDAELNLVDILYGFHLDLIASERGISYYAFLESPDEVAALLNRLEQELITQP